MKIKKKREEELMYRKIMVDATLVSIEKNNTGKVHFWQVFWLAFCVKTRECHTNTVGQFFFIFIQQELGFKS